MTQYVSAVLRIYDIFKGAHITVFSKYLQVLEFNELLGLTRSFTNVCGGSLHAQVLDFTHL